MRRRKGQPRIAVKCDYCKTETESFVVTAKHLRFCRLQTPGFPPDKDCMEDYLNEKKKEKQSIYAQKKEQFQEEEKVLTDKTTAIRKLEASKQFLNNKKSRQL